MPSDNTDDTSNKPKDQFTMQDPIQQYPQPEIPEQQQPEPGLTSKMIP